jgi:CubicO group peptidase (beta-lactamase class C family)
MKLAIGIGIASLLAVGCTRADMPAADAATRGFSSTVLDTLWSEVQGHADRQEIPGAVILLMRDGRTAALRTFGVMDFQARRPMTEDAIFRLASASKVVTCAAFLTLVDDGLVGLDDRVADYLPAFAAVTVFPEDGGAPRPAQRAIRVVDLLRHTSGYGGGAQEPQQSAFRRAGILTQDVELNWTHPWTLSEWVDRLAATPLAREPATQFAYGLSSDILAALMERVTGQPLGEILAERLLGPLGMEDTGFWVPEDKLHRLTGIYDHERTPPTPIDVGPTSRFRQPPRAPSGGGGWDSHPAYGGLVSTAPDFARLLQMILNGGVLDGVRVLERETAAVMTRNLLDGLPSEDSLWPGVGFSTGMAVVHDSVRFDDGQPVGAMWWAGSTNVHFWIDPSRAFVGILMVQARPFGHLDLMSTVADLSSRAIAAGSSGGK